MQRELRKVTYGQLRRVLTGLGFDEIRRKEGRALKHRDSDTIFLFRPYSSRDTIKSAELENVRDVLDNRGFLNADAFHRRLIKARGHRRLTAMHLLPLDDPRWKELDHRNWSNGKPSAPDAPIVPDVLAKLMAHPSDLETFRELWPYLCSEGTAWAAAYAVVPYAVALAQKIPPEARFEYLYFTGLVEMCSSPEDGKPFAIQAYLRDDYLASLADALPLIAETLSCQHDFQHTCYLLAAVAALKGHRRLANALNQPDALGGE